MKRKSKKATAYIKNSTPIVTIAASDLEAGVTIVRRSGKPIKVTVARKRAGVVRCQFEGTNGVTELPRNAPVQVFRPK